MARSGKQRRLLLERLEERVLLAADPVVSIDIPAADLINEDFNFSTEKKRVLNQENIVSKEDNIKQHSHTHKVL